MINKMMN